MDAHERPEAAGPCKVLVTGAEGFIGRHVVAALLADGHEVVSGIRRPRPAGGPVSSLAPMLVACDFDSDTAAEDWLPRLDGIEALVNCAGILREGAQGRFETVHVEAPGALFAACARRGVRRVVQVSALGDPADGEFVASKHRGDARLASLDLDWVVLRPSVVYSAQGSYGGTSLLRAMAALPAVLVLPGSGAQRLQPVCAEDLAELVARLLRPDAIARSIIEVTGPETLTLEDYLRQWRAWLRVPAPRLTLRVPRPLVALAAAAGERFGTGPLGRTMDAMLARGNVGLPGSSDRLAALLGRRPRSLREALAVRPSFVQDRWQARLHLLDPLLRLMLAVVWIFSAWVGFATPASQAAAILEPAGIGATLAVPLVRAAAAIDLLLGLLLLAKWRTRWVGTLMIGSLLAYTLFIGVQLPGSWMDPFGGLLKNLALLPAVAIMMALADRR
ncbi:MAG: SDR family oxidoreductase [Steroidobacteraceae bacterium]|nr:SDR family oxidoreductase [Steroidobacteraceae bacterium]